MLKKRGRPKSFIESVEEVNWEKLAKQLQEALAKEIADHQETENERERCQTEIIQASGIIKYLELKCTSSLKE